AAIPCFRPRVECFKNLVRSDFMTDADARPDLAIDFTAANAGAANRQERQFFFGMTIAMALVTFFGFAPSFYFRSHSAPPLPVVVHIHGIVFTGWVLIQVVQASLVVMNRVDLHRRFGYAAASFALLVVATGAVVITSSWRGAYAAM